MGVNTDVPLCLPQVLLAYPNAVGCASVSAVKQETEAVLQVQTDCCCNMHRTLQACSFTTMCTAAAYNIGCSSMQRRP